MKLMGRAFDLWKIKGNILLKWVQPKLCQVQKQIKFYSKQSLCDQQTEVWKADCLSKIHWWLENYLFPDCENQNIFIEYKSMKLLHVIL